MAPVRRYLRITKYSVLETRIYLDDPSLAHSWLLNARDPALDKVITAVKPLVLPKLMEERERSSWKGTKKKSIKDVVTDSDFEVSIFLTETDNRHSVVTKHKHFWDTTPTRIQSNSDRLMGETNDAPIDVDVAVLEEDDDALVALNDIPSVEASATRRPRHVKRPRADNDDALFIPSLEDGNGDVIEVNSNDSDDGDEAPPTKRRRNVDEDDGDANDDKKQLTMDVTYRGFAIYGRVLCLVVKRKGVPTKGKRADTGRRPTGQAVMENWLTSTQMQFGGEDEAT